MGFGLLFIGYLLIVPTFAMFFYTVPLAALITAFALYRLSRVNQPFRRGFMLSCLLFPASVAAIVLRQVDATEWFAPYMEALCLTVLFLWSLAMLTGIEWVALETNLIALRGKAFRNRIFVCIYLIPAIILTLTDNISFSESARAFLVGFYVAIVIVGLVVMLLNLLLIYSAYAHICMPEDVNMPRKPSRFAFINRRREVEDLRDAAREEAVQNAKREKRQKKQEKKQSKRRH